MHLPSGETLALTPEQTARAKQLLKRTVDGEVESPTNIVDSWKEPTSTIDWERKEDLFPEEEGFITPSAIAGSVSSPNRLEKHRIKKILVCLLEEEFEVQNIAPPKLRKYGDCFYVTGDGHHRSMVARAIGLDELYAKSEIVPPELLIQPDR
ncbi:hypothetical protein Htur_4930 (plasmid) [Haloterrigena turkmenica DSM 5511]|uniref:ParB/Sulfiredoxin domain-containing protein n=1 Tax=Haloterrigena turkmenica (strain ATCC 51198 / DSM 5511 / JCM 9101 / NCIMB 13204 / VKM B-1734 / 4k) TaxID=543526 RepID=D2S2S0_HALTV|nr:hypothetical protein [Haloterrigena turkmenica]ADB63667.1 hypothetical protein Htur_4930 [Haloterrigena turkmenica DSM 5511]